MCFMKSLVSIKMSQIQNCSPDQSQHTESNHWFGKMIHAFLDNYAIYCLTRVIRYKSFTYGEGNKTLALR